MSTSSKKVAKGKRYSPEEKGEIIKFVQLYNDENGRGGQSVAAKKFSISPLSVGTWMKAAGGSAPVTGAKRGRKPGSTNKPKAISVKGGNYFGRLTQISALANQIDKAESEIIKLKSKFQQALQSL
jgi:transposase-like protein